MPERTALSESEVQNHDISPVVALVNEYCSEAGLTKKEVRILDFGSGRGRTVAALRNLGYAAYGIEIDPISYHNGLAYFTDKGYKPSEFLFLMKEEYTSAFEDNFFDIVLSEQVFEHIKALENTIRELARITKPDGIHMHEFPAKFHFREVHLRMPMVHWLPKSIIRYWLIKLYVLLGIEPHWKPLQQSSAKEKAKVYYSYSIHKTFYRSVRQVEALLKEHGFSTKHVFYHDSGIGLDRLVNWYFPAKAHLESKKVSAAAIKDF